VNPLFLLFCGVLVVAQLALPRRLAFLPLLIVVCHLPNDPVIEAGVTFTPTKLIVLTGLLRAASEHRLRFSIRNPLDAVVSWWAAWVIFTGFFHHPVDSNPITIRLSLAYDVWACYIYARSFIANTDDFLRFCRCLILVLLPLGGLMVVEKATGQNPYSVIGGKETEIRDGRMRAAGPFGHAILAGTFGAACVPLVLLGGRKKRLWPASGLAACMAVAVCSNSSGPLMTLSSGLMGLCLWPLRRSVRTIRLLAVFGVIALNFVMNAPVWYLIARIDLTGSSTSYYRAELITQAINHFNEWWLIGTDYTRHWMASGSVWSDTQADLTNYYIKMGVTGGLALLILFVAIFATAFRRLGRAIPRLRSVRDSNEFTLWCVGTTLMAYCITFISVTFFDQSWALFCILLGSVPGLTVPVQRAQPLADHSLATEHAFELPNA